MAARARMIAGISTTPLIADADTGYGGLLNVHHTVRGYEAAGVTAIQLEDQEFPKKCGHTPFKRLIPLEDMAEKIKVAVDSRISEDFVVIARTDARESEGMDGVLRRMEAYSRAGADVLFPEALHSEEEMRKACSVLDKPCMANMSNHGKTPVPTAEMLAQIGYAYAIYPSLTSLAAAAAMETVLTDLKNQGIGQPDGLFNFGEFCSLIGFEEVWDFERKWARDQ
jgi:2-methylisocitrate lyase-like PEP mutase family enzyme